MLQVLEMAWLLRETSITVTAAGRRGRVVVPIAGDGGFHRAHRDDAEPLPRHAAPHHRPALTQHHCSDLREHCFVHYRKSMILVLRS